METTIDEIVNDSVSPFRQVMDFQLFRLGEHPVLVSQIVLLLVMVIGVFVFEFLFRRYAMLRLLRKSRLQPSLQYALSRIFGYIVIAIGLFIALQTVGLNLSSLAIFAGAIGVGVGFGLQNIISNFMSGLIILAERRSRRVITWMSTESEVGFAPSTFAAPWS